MNKITVGIPAFNEEKNIAAIIIGLKKITDEIDHEFHRESILNAVRTFKTSRRKQAQKKDKKKKPKQWALKRKPRSIKDLSN